MRSEETRSSTHRLYADWMRSDRIAGLLIFLSGVATGIQSLAYPVGSFDNPGPAYAPLLLSVLLALLGLLTLLTGGSSPRLRAIGWSELPHGLRILGGGIFAALALERLGYRLTMLVLLLVYLGVVERRPLPLTLAVSFGVAFGTYYLFATLLRVPLPTGPLGF